MKRFLYSSHWCLHPILIMKVGRNWRSGDFFCFQYEVTVTHFVVINSDIWKSQWLSYDSTSRDDNNEEKYYMNTALRHFGYASDMGITRPNVFEKCSVVIVEMKSYNTEKLFCAKPLPLLSSIRWPIRQLEKDLSSISVRSSQLEAYLLLSPQNEELRRLYWCPGREHESK